MKALSRLRASFRQRLVGQLLHGERGARRFKLAGFAIIANILSKALGFLVIIYSTRVALEQLGAERFGVWITIASIAMLLGFMDLGISNSLIGRVAQVSAREHSDLSLPKLISGGLLALLVIGLAVGCLMMLVFAVAPLGVWFKGISPLVASEARITGFVFAAMFGLSIAGQGVFKIYAGIQHGWIAHLTSATGWIGSLVMISFASRFHAPMWYFLFATYGVQQIAGLILSIGLARRGLIEGPRQMLAGARLLRRDVLFKQGQMFFVVQIAFAIAFGSNQLILSSMIGPTEAASFSVLQRMFMIVQVALTIVNLPLWAMYADAFAHGEIGFIRSLLKRSMFMTLASSCIGVLVLVGLQNYLVGFLTGEKMTIVGSTVTIMAVWTVIEACGTSFAMYLNGVGRVKPQAVLGVVHTIGGLPAKIIGVHFFGLNGLLCAIILSYLIFTAAPLLTFYKSECFKDIAFVN